MPDKVCFIISPIGEPDSETRKRADKILKHVITPIVTPKGYKPVRADQISEPGLITSQVIQNILDAPLVIADLTDRNPNVFYELAIRHAIKKPLIQIAKKGESIPFDVKGMRTISIDHQDLDSVEEARKEIEKQIDFAEKNTSKMDTPISIAIDLQSLRQSDNPEQRTLADILSSLTGIQNSIARLESTVQVNYQLPTWGLPPPTLTFGTEPLPQPGYVAYSSDPNKPNPMVLKALLQQLEVMKLEQDAKKKKDK